MYFNNADCAVHQSCTHLGASHREILYLNNSAFLFVKSHFYEGWLFICRNIFMLTTGFVDTHVSCCYGRLYDSLLFLRLYAFDLWIDLCSCEPYAFSISSTISFACSAFPVLDCYKQVGTFTFAYIYNYPHTHLTRFGFWKLAANCPRFDVTASIKFSLNLSMRYTAEGALVLKRWNTFRKPILSKSHVVI